MTTLASIIMDGLDASKPSAAIEGRLYFATDTLHVYKDTGSSWIDVTPTGTGLTNPMTTEADVIVGGASGTPERLGVGSDGQVLTARSSATNGVDWETPSGGSGGGPSSQSNVTGSRAYYTAYQNTTGKPLYVSVIGYEATLSWNCFKVLSDSSPSPSTWIAAGFCSNNSIGGVFFIVMPGNYYSVGFNGGSAYVLTEWVEWN